MRQEIVNDKVYFLSDIDTLSDLGKIKIKSKALKKLGKKAGKVVKKAGKVVGKLAKPALTVGAVYFGAPVLFSKVVPALGDAGKGLIGKIASSKTGSWWVKQGNKIVRVFKKKDPKTNKDVVITQEIGDNNPLYEELKNVIADGKIFKNSEVENLINKKIPLPLPSGLSKEVVETASSNMDVVPMTDEYKENKEVEVKPVVKSDGSLTATAKEKGSGVGMLLPLLVGGGLLLL